eukprot:UN05404
MCDMNQSESFGVLVSIYLNSLPLQYHVKKFKNSSRGVEKKHFT